MEETLHRSLEHAASVNIQTNNITMLFRQFSDKKNITMCQLYKGGHYMLQTFAIPWAIFLPCCLRIEKSSFPHARTKEYSGL